MELQVWCQTDVGLKRNHNEDSFLFNKELDLYLVADGMGGHRGGEIASKLAVETVEQVIGRHSSIHPTDYRSQLVNAYKEASQKIYSVSQQPGSDLQGMGTTLVAALFRGGVMYIGNVGDSRAYLFAQDQIWQMTEDHSLINEQLRAGLLSESELSKVTAKNVITRSVGFEEEVQVDVIERAVAPGDLILICSDGLSGLVPDHRIAEICRSAQRQDIVSICIDEAKKNGGDDNVTVMVIYAEQ